MDLSGIIFVVLALAWAGYLIPKALKHHDEVARSRSIDRFSTAMRVLARREPVSGKDSRLVVTPRRAADNPRVLVPAPSPTARRTAARAAARRRRRILSALLVLDAAVAVLAVLQVLAVWAPAVPMVLTVLYLVLCRTQVRHEGQAAWDRELADVDDRDLAEGAEAAPRRAVRVDTAAGSANEQGLEEFEPDEDTVAIPVALLEAVAVPTVEGGSLWDPLPMTLPTYVSKPKVSRTVRTIDLTEPGTWTSGHSEADTALVQQAGVPTQEELEPQRAVGS